MWCRVSGLMPRALCPAWRGGRRGWAAAGCERSGTARGRRGRRAPGSPPRVLFTCAHGRRCNGPRARSPPPWKPSGAGTLTRGGFLKMRGYDFPPGGILWDVQGPTTTRREAMFCQAGFDQCLTTIMQHLSPLSKPQATVLALWSFGMVLARSCALTAVSHVLAKGMQRKEQTVRQQLREWYYEPARKRGSQRQALHVEMCFAPLLGWVVSWWQGTQLALAIDATTLGQRFVVLAVSVLYRCCAVPAALAALPAGTKRAWRREWLRLLRLLRPAIPHGWTVIVLADRGLYAPWLFRRITRLGWHPFLRINMGGSFRPAGAPCWRPLASLTP